MDTKTASYLNDLTSAFYQAVGPSFSATRQAPWPGWDRACAPAQPHDLTVLDLACGNLRFPKYLHGMGRLAHAWAFDNCDDLAAASPVPHTSFCRLDVLHELFCGHDLARALDAPVCDLCVCFGFMHHVALPQHRLSILQALASHTRPGGLVVVSFWQFARSPRIMAKAQPLDSEGDYLLGWQGRTDVQRYCHSFSDQEIHELVRALEPQATLADAFLADGKLNNLNSYISLQIS